MAGAATGDLSVGLGSALSEGLGAGLGEGQGAGGGGLDGGSLQYPLLGSAPYDPPKALPPASEPLFFPHRPKELKKSKSHRYTKHANNDITARWVASIR